MDELVDGHQLHRRHAQALEVLDGHRVGEARVRAAQLVGDPRVARREALDVNLVDDRLVGWVVGRTIALPVEVGIDHDRARDERGAVGVVARPVGIIEVVREDGLIPGDTSLDRLGVRVKQQLGRIAAQPVRRVPWAMDPIPVALPAADARQVGVPDVSRRFGHLDPRLDAVVVEQAQLHALGDLGEQREVGSPARVGGSERVGEAGPDDAFGGHLVSLAGMRRQGRIGWVSRAGIGGTSGV